MKIELCVYCGLFTLKLVNLTEGNRGTTALQPYCGLFTFKLMNLTEGERGTTALQPTFYFLYHI